jgi:geranylgeranyl pyrophosphate synthase
MHVAGITDQTQFSRARSILLPLGEYFQVQDDYLDCYGAPEAIGKIGTDIIDNKCSWNVNIALGLCDANQRKILDVRPLPLLLSVYSSPTLFNRTITVVNPPKQKQK